MFKYFSIMIAGMILFVASAEVMASWDSPYITPVAPAVGENVSINIEIGYCDALVYQTGYPEITKNGSNIKVVQRGVHAYDSELCIYPYTVATIDIGAYQSGHYTVSFYMRYRDFLSNIQEAHLGDAEFTVAAPAAPPAPVPSLGAIEIWILASLIGLAVLWRGSLRGGLLLCATIFFGGLFSPSSKADGVIAVLVSSASGAPTPSAVVSYANASRRAGAPPLQAFNTAAPLSGTFLIPDRASGDFLAWLNNNPNSPRKKLEDYALLTYASTNVNAALASLAAGSHVVATREQLPTALLSAGLCSLF